MGRTATHVAVIRFNLSDETIRNRLEPFLQLIPIGFHLPVAIIGLVWKVYNPGGNFFCFIGVWPMDCGDVEAGVPCTRGGNDPPGRLSDFFGLYLLLIPLMIWVLLLCAMLVVVVVTVVVRYRKQLRFVFRPTAATSAVTSSSTTRGSGSNNNSNGNNTTASSITATTASIAVRETALSRQTRQVIIQCLLYGVTFVNTLIWSSMSTFFMWHNREMDYYGKHYWINVLSVLFFPLQVCEYVFFVFACEVN